MRSFALILSVLLTCSVAWAEEAAPEEGSGGSGYLQALVNGHQAFGRNDYEAAIRAYQRALEVRGDDAGATYYLACAQRANGSLEQALDSFQRAAELAGTSDRAMHARALFNVALVQEARRQLGPAREAWRAYIAYAEANQRVPTYVANARQRLGAITAVEELDAAYQPVRERIAARAASSEGE